MQTTHSTKIFLLSKSRTLTFWHFPERLYFYCKTKQKYYTTIFQYFKITVSSLHIAIFPLNCGAGHYNQSHFCRVEFQSYRIVLIFRQPAKVCSRTRNVPSGKNYDRNEISKMKKIFFLLFFLHTHNRSSWRVQRTWREQSLIFLQMSRPFMCRRFRSVKSTPSCARTFFQTIERNFNVIRHRILRDSKIVPEKIINQDFFKLFKKSSNIFWTWDKINTDKRNGFAIHYHIIIILIAYERFFEMGDLKRMNTSRLTQF